ncbi:LOW QUALITY PROTEIN: Helitron helicase [Phytophthora megakarya]|uniref:Helitron helicase n=1 Tax=Phytophthora megakarya TaxID=4795 RepID=A0A225UG78_9STRA|nr:LOW QUALITY PROTEIN: Helitron helicase [Phytophthora megakarya]
MSSIGRIVHVLPQDPVCFFFRLLLCHRRSPKSYEYLWIVGDIVYPTFRDAAFAIGYLEDNQEWLHGLTEAAAENMSYQLHQLIAIGLVYSLPTRADKEVFKAQISEDFARNFEENDAAENIHREDEYKMLKYVAHYLASNGKTLEVYGLTELRAYSNVSAEVDGPATESIVQ